MDDIQAALDAMAAAEQEARSWLNRWAVLGAVTGLGETVAAFKYGAMRDDGEKTRDEQHGRWARDRVALVVRDRATLERHKATPFEIELPERAQLCAGCTWGGSTRHLLTCPERQAVIDYWTRETG